MNQLSSLPMQFSMLNNQHHHLQQQKKNIEALMNNGNYLLNINVNVLPVDYVGAGPSSLNPMMLSNPFQLLQDPSSLPYQTSSLAPNFENNFSFTSVPPTSFNNNPIILSNISNDDHLMMQHQLQHQRFSQHPLLLQQLQQQKLTADLISLLNYQQQQQQQQQQYRYMSKPMDTHDYYPSMISDPRITLSIDNTYIPSKPSIPISSQNHLGNSKDRRETDQRASDTHNSLKKKQASVSKENKPYQSSNDAYKIKNTHIDSKHGRNMNLMKQQQQQFAIGTKTINNDQNKTGKMDPKNNDILPAKRVREESRMMKDMVWFNSFYPSLKRTKTQGTKPSINEQQQQQQQQQLKVTNYKADEDIISNKKQSNIKSKGNEKNSMKDDGSNKPKQKMSKVVEADEGKDTNTADKKQGNKRRRMHGDKISNGDDGSLSIFVESVSDEKINQRFNKIDELYIKIHGERTASNTITMEQAEIHQGVGSDEIIESDISVCGDDTETNQKVISEVQCNDNSIKNQPSNKVEDDSNHNDDINDNGSDDEIEEFETKQEPVQQGDDVGEVTDDGDEMETSIPQEPKKKRRGRTKSSLKAESEVVEKDALASVDIEILKCLEDELVRVLNDEVKVIVKDGKGEFDHTKKLPSIKRVFVKTDESGDDYIMQKTLPHRHKDVSRPCVACLVRGLITRTNAVILNKSDPEGDDFARASHISLVIDALPIKGRAKVQRLRDTIFPESTDGEKRFAFRSGYDDEILQQARKLAVENLGFTSAMSLFEPLSKENIPNIFTVASE